MNKPADRRQREEQVFTLSDGDYFLHQGDDMTYGPDNRTGLADRRVTERRVVGIKDRRSPISKAPSYPSLKDERSEPYSDHREGERRGK